MSGFRGSLTARQTRVLVMRLVKLMSYGAIGRELGISAAAARSSYKQAEHRLVVADRRKDALKSLAAAKAWECGL